MMVKNHVACPNPKCGSSDGASIYKNTTSEGVDYFSGFCYSCKGYIKPDVVSSFYGTDFESDLLKPPPPFEPDPILEMESRGWRERRVGLQASQFYGIRNEVDAAGNLTGRWYPITNDGELVGFKKRILNPKGFFSIGTNSTKCDFFGQSLFPPGGKFLIITGGEEDAASMYQAMKMANDKYDTPVVSPTVGESSLAQQIRNNYDWVSSFERVVLMLDNDTAGQAATEEAVRILRPGQGYIAKLRLKDPNEYLKAHLEAELVNAFWKAERYSPAGIVGSSQTYDALLQRAKWEKVMLPDFASELQKMLNGGPALGEITTIASASGTGKSTISNEFLYHWIMNSPYKVGIIPLESDVGELTENLMTLQLNRKLANMPDEEKELFLREQSTIEAHKKLTLTESGEDRYIIVDHQGDVVDGDLKSKMEYLVKVCQCKLIILDPMTLALSGAGNDGTDEFMAWLLRFVKREMISHVNVVHVRKNSGGSKANSTGADIHEESIKGCLPAETEFLTPQGWKPISNYREGDLVGQWENGTLTFVTPEEYIRLPATELYRIYNDNNVDMVFSEEHRVPYIDQSGKLKVRSGIDVFYKTPRAFVPVNFIPESADRMLPEALLRVMVMVAADGCYHGNGLCKIQFTKQRKKERCRKLLTEAGIEFSETSPDEYTVFRFRALTNNKELHLCHNWYTASARELSILLDECLYWDGSVNQRSGDYFCTAKREEAEVVQFAAHACQRKANLREYTKADGLPFYQVSIPREGSYKNRVAIRSDSVTKEIVKTSDGFKYCFVVPSSFFIARNNGKIFVTGNSGSQFQVSMNNILLMRDKENADPLVRNTTRVVLSKARRTGKTGPAGFWFYNDVTGRVERGQDPRGDYSEMEQEFGEVGGYDQTDPDTIF